MKKVLFATTALVLSAGVAAADVAVSGNGRMGIVDGFTTDLAFTSRIRIAFTASGETDGGLSFGGSIRADNSGNGAAGTAGNIFISGGFGKVTMGDVDGAAEAAAGNVRGVGLTGLGDLNDASYLSNSAAGFKPTMRYDYTVSGFGVHISADQPSATDGATSIGFTYGGIEGLKLGLGFETRGDDDHIIVGGSYALSPSVTLAATYGQATVGGDDETQMALSAAYTMDALTVSAYYADNEIAGTTGTEAFGLGGQYNLGGGASVSGGWVSNETTGNTALALGVNFSF